MPKYKSKQRGGTLWTRLGTVSCNEEGCQRETITHSRCWNSLWFLVSLICPVVLKLGSPWHHGTTCMCAEILYCSINDIDTVKKVDYVNSNPVIVFLFLWESNSLPQIQTSVKSGLKDETVVYCIYTCMFMYMHVHERCTLQYMYTCTCTFMYVWYMHRASRAQVLHFTIHVHVYAHMHAERHT